MPLKICAFAPVPPPLVGSSYAVQLLLESRFREVFDVHHIDTSYSSSVADMGRPRPQKVLRLFGYLARLLRATRRGYDHVLLTPAFTRNPFLKDAIAILTVKWLTNAKLVLWSNSNDLTLLYERSGKPLKALIRYVVSRADHVVTVGESLTHHFKPFLPATRISVIPNGIPDRARAIQRNSRDIVRVLYLSNMLRTKGWELLLRAAGSLCADHPAVHFDFYGAPSSDSSLGDIESRFAMTGFPDRIRYHGPVDGDAKLAALEAADIFCLPTMYPTEALPLAILEAFRDSLPVVSTPIGAIADAVVPAEGGFLTQPGNLTELELRLRELIEKSAMRERMGHFNRERYESMYEMRVVANEWVQLFEQLDSSSPVAEKAA